MELNIGASDLQAVYQAERQLYIEEPVGKNFAVPVSNSSRIEHTNKGLVNQIRTMLLNHVVTFAEVSELTINEDISTISKHY